MDVGVRELKQNLSRYLDRAERGELVRVTDRGHPKALLGPLPGAGRLAEGVQAGWIVEAVGPKLRPTRRWRSKDTITTALDEDRGA